MDVLHKVEYVLGGLPIIFSGPNEDFVQNVGEDDKGKEVDLFTRKFDGPMKSATHHVNGVLKELREEIESKDKLTAQQAAYSPEADLLELARRSVLWRQVAAQYFRRDPVSASETSPSRQIFVVGRSPL